MTHSEKVNIMSMKYENMWWRVMMYYPDYANINAPRVPKSDMVTYNKKKSKFESVFLGDGGAGLRSIMNGTHNAGLMWEIPKGRKCNNEMTMDCAIREFKEETNMRSSRYTLLTTIDPSTESYINMGITYVNKYYMAHTDMQNHPRINFTTNHQVSEIADIRWMNTADVRVVDPVGRLSRQIKKILARYRGYIKSHPRPGAI